MKVVKRKNKNKIINKIRERNFCIEEGREKVVLSILDVERDWVCAPYFTIIDYLHQLNSPKGCPITPQTFFYEWLSPTRCVYGPVENPKSGDWVYKFDYLLFDLSNTVFSFNVFFVCEIYRQF